MVLFHLCFCNYGCEASIDMMMDFEGAILGIFAKLLNATISFVMSGHLSAWNSSASAGWIFMKFDYVGYF
jgi:hypothetical protein